jgi:hypothetical protein
VIGTANRRWHVCPGRPAPHRQVIRDTRRDRTCGASRVFSCHIPKRYPVSLGDVAQHDHMIAINDFDRATLEDCRPCTQAAVTMAMRAGGSPVSSRTLFRVPPRALSRTVAGCKVSHTACLGRWLTPRRGAGDIPALARANPDSNPIELFEPAAVLSL